MLCELIVVAALIGQAEAPELDATPEYSALQAQIARDFGIIPKSMKITIEVEGPVRQGAFDPTQPSVIVKAADGMEEVPPIHPSPPAPLVGTPLDDVEPAKTVTAPVVTPYTAPVPTYMPMPQTIQGQRGKRGKQFAMSQQQPYQQPQQFVDGRLIAYNSPVATRVFYNYEPAGRKKSKLFSGGGLFSRRKQSRANSQRMVTQQQPCPGGG